MNLYMDLIRRNERDNDMGHLANLYDRQYHNNGQFLRRFYDDVVTRDLSDPSARALIGINIYYNFLKRTHTHMCYPHLTNV